jgi:plastocyanin
MVDSDWQKGVSRRHFLKLAGISALVMTGCSAIGERRQYQVNISRRRIFEPSVLVIPRGATVVWQNNDTTIHTITADHTLAQNPTHTQLPEGAQPWDSGRLYPGRFWSRTFEVVGMYIYFCRYYELHGMIGNIVVSD